MIKGVADQLGNQAASDQPFESGGHLSRSYTSVRSFSNKTRGEFLGDINYSYQDMSSTIIYNSMSNLGFTNDP